MIRKYFYLLGLLLLIPAIYVYATDGVSGVEHPAKVNSVVTPDKVCGVSGLAAAGLGSGNIMNESFEGNGDGYENTWTEENGDPDPDSAGPGTLPSGTGSECIKFVTSADTESSRYDHGSEITDFWFRFFVYIPADLGADTWFFYGINATWNGAFAVAFDHKAEPPHQLDLYVYDGAWSKVDDEDIGLAAWIKVEVKYDATNTAWEWKLDSTPKGNGSLAGGSRKVRYLDIGSLSATTGTFYIEHIGWDSTGYME